MAFVIIRKYIGHNGLTGTYVSISKSMVCFGSDIQTKINKGYAEFYIDKDANKAGFRFTNSDVSGFKVGFDKTSKHGVMTRRIGSQRISKFIPIGVYECKYESKNDMWTFDLS